MAIKFLSSGNVTGGLTLSGALSGTSATFSGTVTASGTVTLQKSIQLPTTTTGSGTPSDVGVLSFGGNYTTGNRLFVDSSGGTFRIQGSANLILEAPNHNIKNSNGFLILAGDAGVRLFYSNSEKLTTTNTGVKVDGNIKIGIDTMSTPSTNADDIVIDKDASEAGITIMSETAGSVRWGDASNSSVGSIEYNHNSDYMRLIVNAAERMRITSSGNVGIGTDTPSALLEIQTAGTTGNQDFQIFSRGESPNYEVFKISRAAGSTELLANQNLTLSADYDANHTSVDSNIIFKTDNVEKMRITPGGSLEVGTATVAAANAAADNIVIKGEGTAVGLTISNSSNAGTGTIFFGDAASSAAAGFRYNHNTGDMAISAEDNITFACDNVGIGTTSPSAKLEVNGALFVGNHTGTVTPTSGIFIEEASGVDTQIQMYTYGGSVFRILGSEITADIGWGSSQNRSVNFNNTGTGNISVGIGTSSPQALLDVTKNSDEVYDFSQDLGQRSGTATIHINNNSTTVGSFGQIMYDSDGSNQGIARIVFIDSGTASVDTAFVNEINNTKKETLRIKANGNVGIGTTSPTTPLNVAGNLLVSTTVVDGQEDRFKVVGGGAADAGNVYVYNDTQSATIRLNSGGASYFTNGLMVGYTSGSYKVQVLEESTNTTNIGVYTNIRGAGTNNYAFYADAANGTSTNFGFYGNSGKNAFLGDTGIGTDSPQGKLDSVAPAADLTDFGRATGSALNIRIANVTNRLGQINFCNDAAPAFGYGSIGMVMTSGSGVGLGDMVFGTKGSGSAVVSTERMRITSGGNVAIGGTLGADSQFRVELKPAATILAGLRIGYNSTSNNYFDGDNQYFRDGAGTTNRMTITSAGQIEFAATYNNTTASAANMHISSAGGQIFRSTSSLKYKTDVKDYDKGLNEVMQLQPKYYKGKNDGDTQFAGLIAEDVNDLGLSEFVQYAEDGTPDALAYTHMVALLVNAIQELKAEVEILKKK